MNEITKLKIEEALALFLNLKHYYCTPILHHNNLSGDPYFPRNLQLGLF